VSATEVAVPGDHEKRCWSSLGRKTPPPSPKDPRARQTEKPLCFVCVCGTPAATSECVADPA